MKIFRTKDELSAIARERMQQRLDDEKEFADREQKLHNYYRRLIEKINVQSIEQLRKQEQSFLEKLATSESEKILSLRKELERKDETINTLKAEIKRLRERIRSVEKAHSLSRYLRDALLVTIDRLKSFDVLLEDQRMKIFQTLNAIANDLDVKLAIFKKKEPEIEELLFQEFKDTDPSIIADGNNKEGEVIEINTIRKLSAK